MKKVVVVAVSLMSVVVSVAKELPQYRVPDSARDPFDKSTVKMDYSGSYHDLLMEQVHIKGVAKTRSGENVGIFNKGALRVGDIVFIKVNKDKVKCELVALERDTITASFKIDSKVYKIIKK